ncbi:MAG: methyltransferase domain-containing protein [Actinomycetota bacterium]|nr:methyltransferase domain-containing protein [Actinomycetota bacterium]
MTTDDDTSPGDRRPVPDVFLPLLCCPADHGPLRSLAEGLECERCNTRYPVRDGVVSFMDAGELSEIERREQRSRDEESSWYDTMFEGYSNAVEVPTVVRRIGQPRGPILDHGSGTGRITERLLELGRPVVAVDYSAASLRRLLDRCAGAPSPVLAVQADIRRLPFCGASFGAVTSIQVYEHIRGLDERRRVLEELSRVMTPGAPLSLSAFNYNAMFRAWSLLGNEGAREGEHMLGGDFYYIRHTGRELRAELEAVFDVEELAGIRNIPARKVAGLAQRVGLPDLGDRFLGWMVARGYRVDMALERTPLSAVTGFWWLARAVRRPASASASAR